MPRFEDREELLDALLEIHGRDDLLQAIFARIPKSTLERVLKSEIAEIDDTIFDEPADDDGFGFDR